MIDPEVEKEYIRLLKAGNNLTEQQKRALEEVIAFAEFERKVLESRVMLPTEFEEVIRNLEGQNPVTRIVPWLATRLNFRNFMLNAILLHFVGHAHDWDESDFAAWLLENKAKVLALFEEKQEFLRLVNRELKNVIIGLIKKARRVCYEDLFVHRFSDKALALHLDLSAMEGGAPLLTSFSVEEMERALSLPNCMSFNEYALLRLRKEKERLMGNDLVDAGLIGKKGEFLLRPADRNRCRAVAPMVETQSRGDFKEKVWFFIVRDKCKAGQSVPGKKVRKWVFELAQMRIVTTENQVRVYLSRLGYSKEKKTT